MTQRSMNVQIQDVAHHLEVERWQAEAKTPIKTAGLGYCTIFRLKHASHPDHLDFYERGLV